MTWQNDNLRKMGEIGLIGAVTVVMLKDFRAAVRRFKRQPSPCTKKAVNTCYKNIVTSVCANLVMDEKDWRKRCWEVYLEAMGGEEEHQKAMARCREAEEELAEKD